MASSDASYDGSKDGSKARSSNGKSRTVKSSACIFDKVQATRPEVGTQAYSTMLERIKRAEDTWVQHVESCVENGTLCGPRVRCLCEEVKMKSRTSTGTAFITLLPVACAMIG